MNQYSAIREVRRLLRAVMEQSQRPELIEQLEEIDVRLKAFHDRGIDFKEVVDGLDDSIMITDAEGTVLYINPAYTRNTEITEEDVLNRDVRSLIGKDKLFTGGAVTSVLEEWEERLSALHHLQDRGAVGGLCGGDAHLQGGRQPTPGSGLQPAHRDSQLVAGGF